MRPEASCEASLIPAQAVANTGMLFGHNSNVKAGGTTYHVQTEDRGATNALIDTTVYFRGRVLHRRTNNYFDLLPLNTDSVQALKQRLDEQHRAVVEELRTGTLHLALPHDEKDSALAAAPGSAAAHKVLLLELINPKSWLSGKRALLQVAVRNQTNQAVEGARVTARVDGARKLQSILRRPGHSGMPSSNSTCHGWRVPTRCCSSRRGMEMPGGICVFQLRTKPRVPSAS